MSQDPYEVPRPRIPYEPPSGQPLPSRQQPGECPGKRPPVSGQSRAAVASLRAERRKARCWMVTGGIALAVLLAAIGYAAAARRMSSRLEMAGPVIFLTCLADIRLSARPRAMPRAAGQSPGMRPGRLPG